MTSEIKISIDSISELLGNELEKELSSFGDRLDSIMSTFNKTMVANLNVTFGSEGLSGELNLLEGTLINLSGAITVLSTEIETIESAFSDYMSSISRGKEEAEGFKNILGELTLGSFIDSLIKVGKIGAKTITLFPKLAFLITSYVKDLGIASKLVGSISSGLSMMIPTAIILGGIALIDHFTITLKEQKEIVAELESKYNSLNSELKKLRELENPNEGQKERIELIEKQIKLQEFLLEQEKDELAQKTITDIISSNTPLESSLGVNIYKLRQLNEDIKKYSKPGESSSKLENAQVEGVKFLSEMLEDINKLKESYEILGEEAPDNVKKLFSEFEDLDFQIRKSTDKTTAFEETQNELNQQLKQGIITQGEYNKKLEELQKTTEKAPDLKSQEELNKIYDKANNTVDTYQSNIKNLTSFYNTLNNSEKISADNLIDLIQKYPDYTEQIVNVNNSKKTGIELAKELFKIEQESTLKNLELKKVEIEEEKKLYGIEQERLTAQLETQLQNGLITSTVFATLVDKIPKFYSTQLDAIQEQIDLIKSLTFDDFLDDNSQTTLNYIDDTYFAIEEKIQGINHELEKNKLLQQSASAKDKIALLEEENELYKNLQEAYKEQNALREEEIASVKKSISGFVQFDASGRNIIKITKKLTDQEADLVSQYQGLTDAVDDTSLGIISLNNNINDNINSIKDLKDESEKLNKQINEQIQLQKELQQQYEQDGKYIEELFELTKNLIKQGLQDEIDILNEKKDIYKEIIELKKQEIDKAEEQKDYEKERTEKEKELARLQSELMEISRDDSLEAQAEKLQLEEEIAEKQEELSEYINDRNVELRKEALDEELNAYEQTQDDEIKKLEEKVNDANYIVVEANRLLNEDIENNSAILYEKLIEWNSKYGTGIEQDIITAWDHAYESMMKYKNAAPGGDISFNSAGKYYDVESIKSQMYQNSLNWHTADESTRNELASANRALAKIIGATYNKAGYWVLDGERLYEIPKYDNGGKSISTHGAIVHGTSNSPEWIFNDNQLKSVIASSVKTYDLLPKIGIPSNYIQPNKSNLGGNILSIENLIKIEGNVDKTIVPKIESIADKVVMKINKQFSSNGQLRPIQQF